MRNKTRKEEMFRCTCGGIHFMCFTYWEDEENPELFIETIDPETMPLWERLKRAWLYIFKSNRQYWHEIVLDNDQDLERLKKFFDEYYKLINKK